MVDSDHRVQFAAEQTAEQTPEVGDREQLPWQLLIVDDDTDIHHITRAVLKRLALDGRRLHCISAFSAAEAEQLLRQPNDIAVMLLDVVMETEHAGLELVHLIRTKLNNHFVRIILRTGQPGQAPEKEVIARYDINDYKEKTELTATKLLSTVTTALRGYRDLRLLEARTQALSASEERYHSLVQSTSDAIITVDQTGLVVFWNHGAQSCFGYQASEMMGRPVLCIIPDPYRERHEQALQRLIRTGQPRLFGRVVELEGVHRDGHLFPIEVSLSSWTAQGQRYFSAIIRDIAERRQAMLEIERAYHARILISALLETALEPLTLQRQLEVSLDILHSLPWLSGQSMGAIFLVEHPGKTLHMAAQRGFSAQHATLCQTIHFGECLCGQAAATGRILFTKQVDQRHTKRPDGMRPHGHYCVPVSLQQRLLGVVNLYVEPNHVANQEEEMVLTLAANTLAGIIERRMVEGRLQQTHDDLRKTRLEIIHRLGMAAEYRDNETGMHIIRMSQYAALLGRQVGLDEQQCEILLNASPMHDVGKIGIPDRLLLKPGRLSRQEFEIMKSHTLIGSHMLFGHDDEPLRTAYLIALTHHEKWDGSGYPNGLSGDSIPLEGRICAVADVFDALTSERPYKKAWSVEQAMAEIERCAGSHFDPELVRCWRAILPGVLEIRKNHSDVALSHIVDVMDRLDTADANGLAVLSMDQVPLANWNNAYDIGVATIDQEHRVLVHWINRLNHAIRSDQHALMTDEILVVLKRYIEVHFNHEEVLMERCRYPDLDTHRAQHVLFTQQVDGYIEQLLGDVPSSHRSRIALELLHFLMGWLFNHISKSDRAIALFLKG
ncbi:MAG: bacteriohemerythrin [Magnetococcales bacterium]|nr:bacteriohemerythrin [Magnetococcales bacterium]